MAKNENQVSPLSSKKSILSIIICLIIWSVALLFCGCMADGNDGKDGKDGQNGQNGTQFYSGKTDISLINLGVDGDYYYDTDDYILYQKHQGIWKDVVVDFGKKGSTPTIVDGYWFIDGVPTGVKAVGDDGDTQEITIEDNCWCIDGVNTGVKVNGEDGTIWDAGVDSVDTLNTNQTGKNGDFYLNVSSYDVYKKEAGTWTLIGNIKGRDVDESRIDEIEDQLNNGEIDIERLSNYQNEVVYDKVNLIPEDAVWGNGKYVNAVIGTMGENASYIAIETYIPVEAGSSYVLFGNETALKMLHYAYYDSAKTFLSGDKIQLTSPVFTAPNDAYYIRFSQLISGLGRDYSFSNLETGAYVMELYKQTTSVYSKPTIVAEICGLDADTTLIDGSIGAEKTNFFNKYNSPNILDNYVAGYYGQTKDEILRTNAIYCVFEKMPVTPGNYVSMYIGLNPVQMRWITAFDAQGNVISATATTGVNQDTYKYLVPSDCSYVTITILQRYYTEGETLLQIQCTEDGLYLGKYYEPGVPIYQLKQEYYAEFNYTMPLHCYLPSEICVADNTTIELYYSQICLEYEDYNFQWIASFGRAFEWKFQITGNKSYNGTSKTLTLNLCDDDLNVKYTADCIVKFVSSDITVDQLIIPIGDSLTNNKAWLSEVNKLSNGKISFRGTQGTTSKSNTTTMSHEGRSGATPGWYNSGDSQYTYNPTNTTLDVKTNESSQQYTSNPFWNPTTNKFDFDYYCDSTADGGAGYFQDAEGNEISISPTGVQIYLGTNGIKLDSTDAVEQIKLLIENIQASTKGKNIPIYVVNTLYRPTQIFTTSADGFTTNSSGEHSFQANMKVMNLAIALYDALKDNQNVVFVPVATTHDSEHNFPYTMENINPRNDSEQYKVYTDTVHPTEAGYFQMADIMFSTIAAHYSN